MDSDMLNLDVDAESTSTSPDSPLMSSFAAFSVTLTSTESRTPKPVPPGPEGAERDLLHIEIEFPSCDSQVSQVDHPRVYRRERYRALAPEPDAFSEDVNRDTPPIAHGRLQPDIHLRLLQRPRFVGEITGA